MLLLLLVNYFRVILEVPLAWIKGEGEPLGEKQSTRYKMLDVDDSGNNVSEEESSGLVVLNFVSEGCVS